MAKEEIIGSPRRNLVFETSGVIRVKVGDKYYKLNYDKETTDDEEKVESYIDIIDRLGLKQLTSALKDLNDILNPQSDVEEPDDDEKVQIINDLPKD